jgi:uncharacterized protein (TIGR03086 family)
MFLVETGSRSVLAGLDPSAAFAAALTAGFIDDPLNAYRESARLQQAAFEVPGALEVLVNHPNGEIDARQFLALRLGDLLLHGWDMARSTGGCAALDDDLVRATWDVYEPMLGRAQYLPWFGEGPSGLVNVDALLSQRLLDLTGRRP